MEAINRELKKQIKIYKDDGLIWNEYIKHNVSRNKDNEITTICNNSLYTLYTPFYMVYFTLSQNRPFNIKY